MRLFTDFIDGLSFLELAWIFGGFFVIHELEEWNIASFEKKMFTGLPPTHNDRNARAWIAVACLACVLWCAAATLPANQVLAAWIIFPFVFFSLTNACQHIYWSLRFRTFASGLWSAALLILPASACLVYAALSRALVPAWYVAGLSFISAIAVGGTIRDGRKVNPVVAAVYGIGNRVARMLGGKGA
jgi:hypothetical protein